MRVNPVLPHDYNFFEPLSSHLPLRADAPAPADVRGDDPSAGAEASAIDPFYDALARATLPTIERLVAEAVDGGAVPCDGWCIDFYGERLHTIDCDVNNRRDPILRSCDYCGHVAGRTRAALDEHARRTHMPPSETQGE